MADASLDRARLEASLAAYRLTWTWLRDLPIDVAVRRVREKIASAEAALDAHQQHADRAQLVRTFPLPRLRALLEQEVPPCP